MLVSFLAKIKDHRRDQGKRYKLEHILFCSILAILSGATSYRKIEAFITTHYDTLNALLGLKWKRMPAYTTVRDIIQGTAPEEVESSFRAHSAQLAQGDERKRWLAFDGKVLRGSFDHFKDQKAVQVLTAYLTDSKIILAHEEIAVKSNEIPAAREMIISLGLSGYIFTLDALHCQEETLRTAKETGNDVIVQVKANQPTLLHDCQTIATTQSADAVYQEPLVKARNRVESRRVRVFLSPAFTHADKWDTVEAVVQVERYRRVFDTQSKSWQDSDETALYISTISLQAQPFCQAIRGHWGIENCNHHVRDVSLGEDKSRIRTNPHIFARLRSFALNILRRNNVDNVSLELFNNCMNINRVLNYAGVLEN